MEDFLLERARKIRLLLLDVDGVLTDGRIIYDSRGRDIKSFDVQDGLGIYLLRKAKIMTMIISARGSSTIKRRAKDMQVERVYENASPKIKIYSKILKRYSLRDEQVCFMGDDLVDLGIMKRAGLSIAVANACSEIKKLAHYITEKDGGRGAIREVCELILKSQGKWEDLVQGYKDD